MSLPKSATADTGLDVLTHALEAYVSVMASDYTDGLALQAIGMVFEYLPRAIRTVLPIRLPVKRCTMPLVSPVWRLLTLSWA